MKVNQLTDEQITAALQSYTEKHSDPTEREAVKNAFNDKYQGFLQIFFKNSASREVSETLAKIARFLPVAATATSLSTGFIAGFEFAVSLLQAQTQEAPVASQQS